jgi:uncharacterized protein YecA (UPF0149 family)
MSVPLDRLYHYLGDCVNHDLLIYRWWPHGSRKLEDLAPLIAPSQHQFENWLSAVFHDQEPLNFDFYTREQIKDRIQFLYTQVNSTMLNEVALDYYADQHIRGTTYFVNQYDITLLVHSEQRSQEMEKFTQKNFIPIYFWSHGLIARDWFRYAAHDPTLKFNASLIQKDFLIYNRAWAGTREYRLAFAEKLVCEKLVNYCKTSFNPIDQQIHYTKHCFANKDFAIQNQQLEQHFVLNTHPATASADYCGEDYVISGMEVVLETLFDDSRLHLTEKILRPIACGKPFILVSTVGSLQYLRNYGFETFDGLIDESYDLIGNSKDRLHAIVQEMKRIASLNNNDKQQLYGKLHEIAERNKQRFFDGLSDQIVKEYKTNMIQGLALANQHRTGKHLANVIQLLKNN